ncbi:helix-turn-helix transcriptional regulator [Solirubrobacter soli]|uniref:helix-turn-helix transcriptional regulator n=1 Tax=Solirubrobacter soli TaxID=363832 RepID=UPI00040E3DD9|nr:LuxR C-terminal-related transcriptional regulator [Solirubrobacter soli]
MIEELVSANGFSPEPEHGALITGLLEAVASDSVPAERLANAGAERLSTVVGDTCIVSLLHGRFLEPIAVSDRLDEAVEALRPLVGQRVAAGQRHDLGGYIERFGLGAEFIASMRAHGRVVGQVVALRRGQPRPFTPGELRVIQVVADVIALGLEDRREPAGAEDGLVAADAAPDKLSRREREILALLALGHTNREIAERVHLSVRTVEWHRARIQSKLHVTGRAALARIARQHGLVGGTAVDPLE